MEQGFTIFPLGDSAATIDLGNTINESLNEKVIAMQQWLQANGFYGQKDIIVAYSSLTIIYDPFLVKHHYHVHNTVFEWVEARLIAAFEHAVVQPHGQSPIVRIPVCYDESFAPDLQAMSEAKQMGIWDIIALHTARIYTSIHHRILARLFLYGYN